MLYLVSTHIGNENDMTFRAIEVLRKVDFILCEQQKITARVLKQYQIENTLIQIDKHNEFESAALCLEHLKDNKSVALISDCGTANVEDPGNILIRLAYENKIRVTAVPGASSLTAALSLCPFNLKRYINLGFLSRKNDARKNELIHYKALHCPLVIFETPYRLDFLITSLVNVFTLKLQVFAVFDLTTDQEKIVNKTLGDFKKQFFGKKIKSEFILIISE